MILVFHQAGKTPIGYEGCIILVIVLDDGNVYSIFWGSDFLW